MSMRRKSPTEKLVHTGALGLINRPEPKQTSTRKQNYDRIACVFQGGGALGAYQVGAYRALHEKGYTPNYLAGVSIGGINCAIIAGNPREKQLEKLHTFWDTVTPKLLMDMFMSPYELLDFTHHLHNQMGATHALMYGLDGFFKPRVVPPTPFTEGTPDTLSYYETNELRSTLESLIDFDLINDKRVTLCLGAVNVVTGDMVYFNNQKMEITPDHVMASGALPPGFPAIKIGDDYYWDGGIYANSPLITVMDALPELDTLCFVVDCFSLQGRLPKNMDQLQERQKDIRYASHSRRLTNVYASRKNLQLAIQRLGEKLSPEALQDPEVKEILALGYAKRFSVVHIIYKGTTFAHSFKDYNFVRSAVNYRMEVGYKNTIDTLADRPWETQTSKAMACSIYGVPTNYFEQH
jgi:NTE family protein